MTLSLMNYFVLLKAILALGESAHMSLLVIDLAVTRIYLYQRVFMHCFFLSRQVD